MKIILKICVILMTCLGAAILLNLSGCEGSATQTTNAQSLTGTLVNVHGDVVAGAKVKIWAARTISFPASSGATQEPLFQTVTDVHGQYSFEGIEPGEYNVFGIQVQSAASVYLPEVRYAALSLNLGVDTLKSPGVITGKVMVNGKPIPEVFCYISGTEYISMTDSSGKFVIKNVAAGAYILKYSVAGFATVVDSPVVVYSGEITALPTKVLAYDVALQPPPPTNVKAVWDSVTEYLVVSWDPAEVSDVNNYEVVGTIKDDPYSSFDIRTYEPNFYSTRFFGPFEGTGPYSNKDSLVMWFKVKTIDVDGNMSVHFSDSVPVTIHRMLYQNSKISIQELTGKQDSTSCRDTLKFVSKYSNPDSSLVVTQEFIPEGYFNGNQYPKSFEESVKIYHDGRTDTITWALPKTVLKSSLDSLKFKFQAWGEKNDAIGSLIERQVIVGIDSNGCYKVHVPGLVPFIL